MEAALYNLHRHSLSPLIVVAPILSRALRSLYAATTTTTAETSPRRHTDPHGRDRDTHIRHTAHSTHTETSTSKEMEHPRRSSSEQRRFETTNHDNATR